MLISIIVLDINESFDNSCIVDKLISKDQELLSKFVLKYDLALKKSARKLGFTGERLEDVVQSTWIGFFESIGNFKKQSHIRTFLFGILLNKAREVWRKEKREIFPLDDRVLEEMVQQSKSECNNCQFCHCLVGPEKELSAKQLLKKLDESLLKMDKKYSEIFYSKFIDGKKTEDLCRDNHISSNNLGVIIHRVRKKLDKDFKDISESIHL